MNGYIDAALYIAITSITFVLLSEASSSIDPMITLFSLSAVAIISFHIFGIHKIKNTYTILLQNWWICLLMSTALALDWVFMLFASIKSNPFVAMAAVFIALAISGFINLFIQTRNKSNIVSILLLLFSLYLLIYYYQIPGYQNNMSGVFIGCIAGVFFYFYILFSVKLIHKTNIGTIQILAIRFWALFIGTYFFLPKSAFSIISNKLGELILLGMCGVVLPIFFNQRALQKLGANIASVLFCLAPPVTYSFYAVINREIVLINICICVVITSALVIPKLFGIFKNKMETSS
ncbi:MAG: hypothetical protein QG673_903 [Pseudomonadota bacterium]|nr:hypothetical protein [Pseudomonadota bacterium]